MDKHAASGCNISGKKSNGNDIGLFEDFLNDENDHGRERSNQAKSFRLEPESLIQVQGVQSKTCKIHGGRRSKKQKKISNPKD